jgi:FkbM family methyltransferase
VLLRPELKCERLSAGNLGARWCVCPDTLTNSSVMYTFGVGDDISAEFELIRVLGLRIYAFDPTPKTVEWMASRDLPDSLQFRPFGIADYDGIARFLPPLERSHVSHTMVPRAGCPGSAVDLPVRRLQTLMQELGHSRLDVLKMDIEGEEYTVIDDVLSSPIAIDQILIEFHHRWPEIGPKRTRHCVEQLRAAGFRLFNVSSNGEEYSFLHSRIIPNP